MLAQRSMTDWGKGPFGQLLAQFPVLLRSEARHICIVVLERSLMFNRRDSYSMLGEYSLLSTKVKHIFWVLVSEIEKLCRFCWCTSLWPYCSSGQLTVTLNLVPENHTSGDLSSMKRIIISCKILCVWSPEIKDQSPAKWAHRKASRRLRVWDPGEYADSLRFTFLTIQPDTYRFCCRERSVR